MNKWLRIVILLGLGVSTVVVADQIKLNRPSEVVNHNNSQSSPKSTPSPTPTNEPAANPNNSSPQTKTSITVAELLQNKTAYAGKNVAVSGIIEIIPRYSENKCVDNNPCDTLYSIDLYLKSSTSSEKIPIYKDGKPYPCSKSGTGFVCGIYTNNQVKVVNAVFVKSRIPSQTSGSSSGFPPQVLEWQDFYYLEVQ